MEAKASAEHTAKGRAQVAIQVEEEATDWKMATTGTEGKRCAELKAILSIEVLRLLQNWYYQLKRVPYFSKDYVRQLFEASSEVDTIEINQYQYYTRPYRGRRLIIMAVYLMIGFKYFVYVYYTLSSVDHRKPEKTLEVALPLTDTFPEVINSSLTWYRFLCLETNCSRLSSPGSIGRALEGLGLSLVNTYDKQLDERTWDQRTRLADDLARLPLFALCKSNWRYLRNPHIYSHIVGIVSVSIECAVMIISCLAVPVLFPIQLPLLMSALCPRINLTRFVQTIGHHLEALLCSQLNHELSDRGEPGLTSIMSESHLGHKTRVRLSGPKHIRQTFDRLNSLLEARRLGLLRLKNPNKLLSGDTVIPSSNSASQLERVAADCFPIELTNWFRTNWSQAFVASNVIILAALFVTLSTVDFLLSHDQTMPRIYRSFGQMMERDNCSLFLRTEPEVADQSSPWNSKTSQRAIETGQLQHIDLDNLIQKWDLLDYLEPSASLGIPSFMLVMTICHVYYAMNYLILVILDMRNQVSVIIELAELRLSCPKRLMRHRESSAPAARPMCLIRNRLFEIVNTNLSIVRTKRLLRSNGRRGSSDLDDRLANQEFALDLMALRGLDLGAYVELLEELQINYWLLMEAIEKSNSSLTYNLIFSHVLNYSFVMISLYMYQAFKEYQMLPLMLGAVPLFTANLLISLASTVHARARKLETQLWSLVASTTAFEDMRVKHLRYFLIKQLGIVGDDGGLALKMFGRLSVTYARIIEFVVWTSSITVFAIRLKY